MIALLLSLLHLLGIAVAAPTCSLAASGGDDAPALVSALRSPACDTVIVPAGKILLIKSGINTQTSVICICNSKEQSSSTTTCHQPYWGEQSNAHKQNVPCSFPSSSISSLPLLSLFLSFFFPFEAPLHPQSPLPGPPLLGAFYYYYIGDLLSLIFNRQDQDSNRQPLVQRCAGSQDDRGCSGAS